MKISLKLKTLRNEKELTQSELSKKLKVALSVIGDIESGRRIPSKNTAIKLSHFFETTVEYWLDDDEEIQYINNREMLASAKDAIITLKEKGHIANGIPSDEAWELIKEAIKIDLKFFDLQEKKQD